MTGFSFCRTKRQLLTPTRLHIKVYFGIMLHPEFRFSFNNWYQVTWQAFPQSKHICSKWLLIAVPGVIGQRGTGNTQTARPQSAGRKTAEMGIMKAPLSRTPVCVGTRHCRASHSRQTKTTSSNQAGEREPGSPTGPRTSCSSDGPRPKTPQKKTSAGQVRIEDGLITRSAFLVRGSSVNW